MDNSQDWTEAFQIPKKAILTTFSAQSYQRWADSFYPSLVSLRDGSPKSSNSVAVGSDKVFIWNYIPLYIQRYHDWGGIPLPFSKPHTARATYPLGPSGRGGEICFDAPVWVPTLSCKKSSGGNDIWMSLMPMEILTQRAGVKIARGKVLIGGLGLGWIARRVLESPKVSHVTIAELDKGVVEFFAPQLKKEFGAKVTIVHDDVYTCAEGDFDKILLDIWPAWDGAEFDKQLHALEAKRKGIWNWGTKVRPGIWNWGTKVRPMAKISMGQEVRNVVATSEEFEPVLNGTLAGFKI